MFFSSTAVEKKSCRGAKACAGIVTEQAGLRENQGGIADVYQTEIGYHLYNLYII